MRHSDKQAGVAHWYAVYTRPRQERIALSHLERQQFDCFLPMADNPRQRRRQGAQAPEPLFSRYLFLKAHPDHDDLAVVRSTRGVVNFVRAGMELVRVPERVVSALRKRCDPRTGLVRLEPDPMTPGQQARVFDGPLAGLEGVFRERCSRTRSVLLVSLLGREVSMQVASHQLQRA